MPSNKEENHFTNIYLKNNEDNNTNDGDKVKCKAMMSDVKENYCFSNARGSSCGRRSINILTENIVFNETEPEYDVRLKQYFNHIITTSTENNNNIATLLTLEETDAINNHCNNNSSVKRKNRNFIVTTPLSNKNSSAKRKRLISKRSDAPSVRKRLNFSAQMED